MSKFYKKLIFTASALCLFSIEGVHSSVTSDTNHSIYLMARPDDDTISKISDRFLSSPSLLRYRREVNGEVDMLIYNQSDLHMTLKAYNSPYRIRDLANYQDESAKKYRTKVFDFLIKGYSSTLSQIYFSIKRAALFSGNRKRFIVLELEPDLSTIKNMEARKRIRNHVLENEPHISLISFRKDDVRLTNIGYNLVGEINELISSYKMKNLKFKQIIAESEKGIPLLTTKRQKKRVAKRSRLKFFED